MTHLQVRIDWWSTTEYLDFELESLPLPGAELKTLEYWPDEKEIVSYKARCSEARVDDGRLVVKLEYLAASNAELVEKGSYWGLSAINLDLALGTGTVSWSDSDDSSRDDTVNCEGLAGLAVEKISRRGVQIIDRPKQAAVRRILLERFKCCALTGEDTSAVLDAVHINAVENGGTTSLANCILLRTDLHRLLDAKLFSICAEGKVLLEEGLSDHYRNLLAGKILPPGVAIQIKTAFA